MMSNTFASTLTKVGIIIAAAVLSHYSKTQADVFFFGLLWGREMSQMSFRLRDKEGIPVAQWDWRKIFPWHWSVHNQWNVYGFTGAFVLSSVVLYFVP